MKEYQSLPHPTPHKKALRKGQEGLFIEHLLWAVP